MDHTRASDTDEALTTALTRRRFLQRGARVGLLAGAATLVQGVFASALAAASSPRRSLVVKASKLSVGSAYAFKNPFTRTPAYLVQPKKGEYRAFSRICTHMGCEVNHTGSTFSCPCHGSVYSASTGQVLHGPAPRPLPSYPVAESGGELYVES